MPDPRSDPQGAHEVWRARYQEAVRAFRAQEFPYSEPVFRATLYGLGFRGREIDYEVTLAKEKSS